MSITAAMIAFLEALGGGRSGPADAPVTPTTAPPQGPSPLAPQVEALSVRMADLEAQFRTLRPFVDEEVDRARRHVEGLRTTVRRLKEFVEGSDDQSDPDPNVPVDHVPAGRGPGVLPMYGGMEGQDDDGEAVRAAARRALSGMS